MSTFFECPYCGRYRHPASKSFDHLIPKCRGGWGLVNNKIACCRKCNSLKANLMPLEAFFLFGQEGFKATKKERRTLLENTLFVGLRKLRNIDQRSKCIN